MPQNSALSSIATSRNTLPVVCVAVVLLWLTHKPEIYDWTILLLSLALASLSVYLIAELNNRFSLLRNGSRMISCLLALLLGMTEQMHQSVATNILLLLFIHNIHATMGCYQSERPGRVFLGTLLLSISTIVQPALWFFIPACFVCLHVLRALTPRCFVAALLGLLVPYWLTCGYILIFADFNEVYQYLCNAIPALSLPDYASIPLQHWAQLSIATILFLAGVIDFYQRNYLDKTQTRINHIAVLIHGFAAIVLIALQMHHFTDLFPLLLIDAAIIGGHYLALTHNRTTLIFATAFIVLWAAVTTMQLWII